MIEKVIEGKAYVNGEIRECCIGIENGRIVSIKKVIDGEHKIKISRGIILPAGIDIHVHFRDPGYTYKEDFSTGSLSALFGGVSFVGDMPNTNPPTTDISSFKEKLSIANSKSYVDFSLYVGITDKNIDRINSLSKIAHLFKVYLGVSTGSLLFDSNRLRALSNLPDNKIVVFHAEDEKCLERNRVLSESLKDYVKSRPSICEKEAVKKIREIMISGKHVHIAHISSISSLKEIESTENMTVGVTPHHLLFNVEQDLRPEPFYKVNPPIRNKMNQEGLLQAFLSGRIDILESDHAPHSLDEKNKNFEDAPSGIPGVETMYPVMLYYFLRKGYPISRLIEAISEKPASALRLKKGRLADGMDADMAVFDVRDVKIIRDEDIHSKCGYSPFSGFKAIFPKMVFIRGEKALDEGEPMVDRGFGRYIGELP